MRRSSLSHRGLIPAEQKDFEGALLAYRKAQQFNQSPLNTSDTSNYSELSDFMVNQLAMARLLDSLGDTDAAVRELEIGLDLALGGPAATAFGLLVFYAHIARNTGGAVPERYKNPFARACRK